MKARQPHIVPLSSQAMALLRELQPLTGACPFLFPGERSAGRPMSNNTLNAALRRLGYGPDDMTAHGFRSMASTLLNELGWTPDAIERQLAHAERDGVRAVYNYAPVPSRTPPNDASVVGLSGAPAINPLLLRSAQRSECLR